MLDKKMKGDIGEEIACNYIIKRCKYKVLMRNFRCKNGEIDIIAKDKDELIFIEVKARDSLLYGIPSEAVNKNKQKNMRKAAEYYLYRNSFLKYYCRFDVIEVYIDWNRFESDNFNNFKNIKINHLRNVEIDGKKNM